MENLATALKAQAQAQSDRLAALSDLTSQSIGAATAAALAGLIQPSSPPPSSGAPLTATVAPLALAEPIPPIVHLRAAYGEDVRLNDMPSQMMFDRIFQENSRSTTDGARAAATLADELMPALVEIAVATRSTAALLDDVIQGGNTLRTEAVSE